MKTLTFLKVGNRLKRAVVFIKQSDWKPKKL